MVLRRRWVTARTVVINGHVGIPIRHGAIEWVKRHWRRRRRVHLWLACEIRDGSRFHKGLGRGFKTYPFEQPFESRTREAMTYVAYRSRRFERIAGWNPPIKPAAYPRRLTAALLWDKVAKREVLAIALHVDPLGRGLVDANPKARARQAAQLREYAVLVAEVKARYPRVAVLVGGDFNQRVGDRYPESVREFAAAEIMGVVGLSPAHREVDHPGEVRLMEVFGNWGHAIRATNRDTVRIPVTGMDHETVIATTKIRRPVRRRRSR